MQSVDSRITLTMYTLLSFVHVFNVRLQGYKIAFARKQLRWFPMCTGGTSHTNSCLGDLPVLSISTSDFAHLIWLRPGNKLNSPYDLLQQKRGTRLDLHRLSCTAPSICQYLPSEVLWPQGHGFGLRWVVE